MKARGSPISVCSMNEAVSRLSDHHVFVWVTIESQQRLDKGSLLQTHNP